MVNSVVRRLLINYITRPHISLNNASSPVFSDDSQPGVLRRVGSAAGMLFLCITFEFAYNFLVPISAYVKS